MKQKRLIALVGMIFLLAGVVGAAEVNPPPQRALLLGEKLTGWEFASNADGWQAGNQCTIAAAEGLLKLTCSGEDPNIFSPAMQVKGPLVVQLRIRAGTAGSGEIFWTTEQSPDWNPKQSRSFRLRHDQQWHEYQVLIDTEQTVTKLRLDPGSAAGAVEIDWVRLVRGRLHPLEVRSIQSSIGPHGVRTLQVDLQNHDSRALQATVNGQAVKLPAGGNQAVAITDDGSGPFGVMPVVVLSPGLEAIRLPVCVYRPQAKVNWIRRTAGGQVMEVAPDGSGARFLIDDKVVAVLAPLVRVGDRIPAMKCEDESAAALVFKGQGIRVRIEAAGEGAKVAIESSQTAEGPVLRAFGVLEQGLLAGVEYLGQGEQSSSKLDIETQDHWRVRPDVMSITMPLMACVTDQVAAALLWEDMALQPVYATPNFLDGADDHRMALEGKTIAATVYIGPTQPLEEITLWAVKQRGLPELPQPPRDERAERQLMLRGFTQSIAGPGGWGHAAEARWERLPYVDIASAIGRLSGDWPKTQTLVSGGAHIRNDAAYFMTGRAKQWIGQRTGEARELLTEQQADGSFRYDGPFRRGNRDNTASGYNAWRAAILLDFAWTTGDAKALEGGIKCLEFMKQFRTPRGAQTHELPLHTPDLLGSAYLVWAYARGYELTGRGEYLELARKWALSGVPFIYQWGNLPTMRYASIPALGATHWVEPNWIGLPVQWCGLVYGYALTMLAPHDQSVDWRKLAQGILITAEQMEYPDGPVAGCFPDFYLLREQKRGGPSVNPGALVSVMLALEGRVDSLAVASNGKHRVVAPFAVTIGGDVARVQGKAGVKYQVVVDGKRVVDVVSQGVDEIKLGGK